MGPLQTLGLIIQLMFLARVWLYVAWQISIFKFHSGKGVCPRANGHWFILRFLHHLLTLTPLCNRSLQNKPPYHHHATKKAWRNPPPLPSTKTFLNGFVHTKSIDGSRWVQDFRPIPVSLFPSYYRKSCDLIGTCTCIQVTQHQRYVIYWWWVYSIVPVQWCLLFSGQIVLGTLASSDSFFAYFIS